MLAERLRNLIANTQFTHEGRPFAITVSIGVAALLPGALAKRRDLLEKADQALYQAKHLGRNQVCTALGPKPVERLRQASSAAKAG